MDGRIPMILDGGACGLGLESTVVSLTGPKPRVLRPGFVTAEEIASVCGETEVDDAALHRLETGKTAASPGMKYRHYSPDARLTVVDGPDEAVARTIRGLYDAVLAAGGSPAVLVLRGSKGRYGSRAAYTLGDTAEEVGEALFTALRLLDADGRTDAFAEAVQPVGVGLAIMNRLLRAAGFRVITAD
jgi:L-threonylcarbamoyladenylate synthase